MLQAIRSRLHRDDRGFTLIELMVVVLIIAILIAIAIPTFMGARTKAQDRAAQVNLRQALLTAKSYYTDSETYAATGAQLNALEPSVSFSEVVGNASQTVVGFTGTTTDVIMEKQSKSGKWFCISDSTTAGTKYGGPVDLQTGVDTLAECAAAAW